MIEKLLVKVFKRHNGIKIEMDKLIPFKADVTIERFDHRFD